MSATEQEQHLAQSRGLTTASAPDARPVIKETYEETRYAKPQSKRSIKLQIGSCHELLFRLMHYRLIQKGDS